MRSTKTLGLVVSLLVVTPLLAREHPAPAAGSAETILSALAGGNRRFVSGRATHPHTERSRVRETGAHGQHPQAVVLACADSRVSPELVLDQGIGDLFTIRVAGNVANEDEAASVEYAVEHLGVPVCVVLGHTGCGAVTAVVHGERLPHRFDHLLSPIQAATRDVRTAHPGLRGDALIEAAVKENVWHAVGDLLRKNQALRDRARTGKLAVVGAVYDTRTGAIRWLGHHPKERAFLAAGGAPQSPK